VLLRSWISSTLTKKSMHLIVGCSTTKEMWECLKKAHIQATKVIYFARGLGLKYKTFVILGKAPYSTLNQFVYALTSFDIREDEEEVPQQNHNMVLSAQKGRGKGNNNINSSETGFKPARQGIGSKNSQYGLGSLNNKSSQSENKERNNIESWQICGRNNHTALKCFYWWDYLYQSTDELSQATTRHHIHTEALTKQVFAGFSKFFFCCIFESS